MEVKPHRKRNPLSLEAQLAIATYEKTHATYEKITCEIHQLFAQFHKESQEIDELGERIWSIFREDKDLIIPEEFQTPRVVVVVPTLEKKDTFAAQISTIDKKLTDLDQSIVVLHESIVEEQLNQSKLQNLECVLDKIHCSAVKKTPQNKFTNKEDGSDTLLQSVDSKTPSKKFLDEGIQTTFLSLSETSQSYLDATIETPKCSQDEQKFQQKCVSVQTTFITPKENTTLGTPSLNETLNLSIVVPKTPFNSYNSQLDKTFNIVTSCMADQSSSLPTKEMGNTTSYVIDKTSFLVDNLDTPTTVVHTKTPATANPVESSSRCVGETSHHLSENISTVNSTENDSEFINPNDTGLDMKIVKKIHEDYRDFELDFVNPNDTNQSFSKKQMRDIKLTRNKRQQSKVVSKLDRHFLEYAEQQIIEKANVAIEETDESEEIISTETSNNNISDAVNEEVVMSDKSSDYQQMYNSELYGKDIQRSQEQEKNLGDNVDFRISNVRRTSVVEIQPATVKSKYDMITENESVALTAGESSAQDVSEIVALTAGESGAQDVSEVVALTAGESCTQDVSEVVALTANESSAQDVSEVVSQKQKAPSKTRKKRRRKRFLLNMPSSYTERRKFEADSKYTFHTYQTSRVSMCSPNETGKNQSKIYQIKRSVALKQIKMQTLTEDVDEVDMSPPPLLKKKKQERRVSIQVNVSGFKENIDATQGGCVSGGEDFEEMKECPECSSESSIRSVESPDIGEQLCEKCVCLLQRREKTFNNKTFNNKTYHRRRSIEQSMLIKTLLRKRVSSVGARVERSTGQRNGDTASLSERLQIFDRPKRSCVARKQLEMREKLITSKKSKIVVTTTQSKKSPVSISAMVAENVGVVSHPVEPIVFFVNEKNVNVSVNLDNDNGGLETIKNTRRTRKKKQLSNIRGQAKSKPVVDGQPPAVTKDPTTIKTLLRKRVSSVNAHVERSTGQRNGDTASLPEQLQSFDRPKRSCVARKQLEMREKHITSKKSKIAVTTTQSKKSPVSISAMVAENVGAVSHPVEPIVFFVKEKNVNVSVNLDNDNGGLETIKNTRRTKTKKQLCLSARINHKSKSACGRKLRSNVRERVKSKPVVDDQTPVIIKDTTTQTLLAKLSEEHSASPKKSRPTRSCAVPGRDSADKSSLQFNVRRTLKSRKTRHPPQEEQLTKDTILKNTSDESATDTVQPVTLKQLSIVVEVDEKVESLKEKLPVVEINSKSALKTSGNNIAIERKSQRTGLCPRKRKSLSSYGPLQQKHQQKSVLSFSSSKEINKRNSRARAKCKRVLPPRKQGNDAAKNVDDVVVAEEGTVDEKDILENCQSKHTDAEAVTMTFVEAVADVSAKAVTKVPLQTVEPVTTGTNSDDSDPEIILNLPDEFKDVNKKGKKETTGVQAVDKENDSAYTTDNLDTIHEAVIENVATPVSMKIRKVTNLSKRRQPFTTVTPQIEINDLSRPTPFASSVNKNQLLMGPPVEPVMKKSKENHNSSRVSQQSSNTSRYVGESTMSYLGRKKKSLFNKRTNVMKTPTRVAPMNSTIIDGADRRSVGMSNVFSGDISKIGQPRNVPEISVMSATQTNASNATYGMPSTLAKYLNQFEQPALKFTKKK